MPEKETLERAREDAREGKSPSTQAGEFVKEEMDHIREGKHGAASTKQAIAIGLSKARRAGVDLPPPGKGKTSAATRDKAKRDVRKGRRLGHEEVLPARHRRRKLQGPERRSEVRRRDAGSRHAGRPRNGKGERHRLDCLTRWGPPVAPGSFRLDSLAPALGKSVNCKKISQSQRCALRLPRVCERPQSCMHPATNPC